MPRQDGSSAAGAGTSSFDDDIKVGVKPEGGRENLVRLVMNSREEQYIERQMFT